MILVYSMFYFYFPIATYNYNYNFIIIYVVGPCVNVRGNVLSI